MLFNHIVCKQVHTTSRYSCDSNEMQSDFNKIEDSGESHCTSPLYCVSLEGPQGVGWGVEMHLTLAGWSTACDLCGIVDVTNLII